MPGEFTHKGVTILITASGGFQYINRGGHSVTKPSLKAAQNAIDKEHPPVVVSAMTSEGRKLEIAERGRGGGYTTPAGIQVGRYGNRVYPWNEEVAAKLKGIRESMCRDDDEARRRRNALETQQAEVLKELGPFDFEAEQAKALEAAREED